ncbi:hypothetical protein PLEOSDRAFT_1111960 [Pleurotus ostreatus PC15]|uniref:Uncharacterized protein n=1 Tax=Pleurotus ostreatus (strain PC15) TaxID=1137138 RepID=A0A067NLQ4_PLEO1|nr:hypothetical protein PLEOSDRAFT_1111960 [Pleurotus ostreatus PC15]
MIVHGHRSFAADHNTYNQYPMKASKGRKSLLSSMKQLRRLAPLVLGVGGALAAPEAAVTLDETVIGREIELREIGRGAVAVAPGGEAWVGAWDVIAGIDDPNEAELEGAAPELEVEAVPAGTEAVDTRVVVAIVLAMTRLASWPGSVNLGIGWPALEHAANKAIDEGSG